MGKGKNNKQKNSNAQNKDKKRQREKPPDKPNPEKKKQLLEQIKANIEKQNERLMEIPLMSLMNDNMFSVFNGQNDQAEEKGKIRDQKKVRAFMSAQEEIEKYAKGAKRVDVKRINELAKKLLTEQEISQGKEMKNQGLVQTQYAGLVFLMNTKLQDIKKLISEGKVQYNKEKDQGISEQEFKQRLDNYKKEIEAVEGEKVEEEEDINMEPEDPLFKQDIDNLNQDFQIKSLEQKIKEIEAQEGQVGGNQVSSWSEEEQMVLTEELKRELEEMDNKDFEDNEESKLEGLKKVMKSLGEEKLYMDKAVEDQQNYYNMVWNIKDWKNEAILANLKDKKIIGPSTVEQLTDIFLKDKHLDPKLALLLMFVVGLAKNQTKMKNMIISLWKVCKAQRNLISRFVKPRDLMEKKVMQGQYKEKEVIKKESKVERAINNINDFAQFPANQKWKEFSKEEKKDFMKKKVEWNIKRLDFLIKKASGGNRFNVEFMDHVPVAKALTSSIYYLDKFATGYKMKNDEWNEFYKPLPDDTRKKLNELRLKGKKVLKKLVEKGTEISGFIKYKGIAIYIKNRYLDDIKFQEEYNKIMDNKKKRDERERGQNRRTVKINRNNPSNMNNNVNNGGGNQYLGKKRDKSRNYSGNNKNKRPRRNNYNNNYNNFNNNGNNNNNNNNNGGNRNNAQKNPPREGSNFQ
jgi:hypothetical protein